jgi:hypothetical protein
MRTIDNDLTDDRLVVSPRVACRLLDTGNTRLYELLAAGELDSYREGHSRKITMESIRRLVRRRLAGEHTWGQMAANSAAKANGPSSGEGP